MTDRLTTCDLRALMAVVEEGRRDAPTTCLPWAAVKELTKIIRCDMMVFGELDLVNHQVVASQWMEDSGEREIVGPSPRFRYTPDRPFEETRSTATWKHHQNFLPFSEPRRAGDITSVVTWSDFYSIRQLRSTPLHADYYRQWGDKYCIKLPLPTSPENIRFLTLSRYSGSDFTERDRLVLQLLRPHIYDIYLDSQRRQRRIPHLSRREWEVLQLAHQGYSNADIAAKLFISIGTVRKHLEHVFDRTGVRSRTAAAALMMPHYSPALNQQR